MTVKVSLSNLGILDKWLKELALDECAVDITNFTQNITKSIVEAHKGNDDFSHILIHFTDITGVDVENIADIFSYTWSYFQYEDQCAFIDLAEFIILIKNYLGYSLNDNDFITDKDLFPVIEDRNIPLVVAKDMYKSNSRLLKEYALSIYNEKELTDSAFNKCRNVPDAQQYIGVTYSINSADKWLAELIHKLNGNISYIESELYLPTIRVIKADDYNKHIHGEASAKFSISQKSTYYICPAPKSEFVPIKGLFNYDSENKYGAVSSHVGNFACATKEIAMFISKYHAREVFIASVVNVPFDSITWYSIVD